jgi:hypothetical protein
MNALGTVPNEPRTTQLCECGQLLIIEMEFDHCKCLDCMSRDAILSGKPLRSSQINKMLRACSFERVFA